MPKEETKKRGKEEQRLVSGIIMIMGSSVLVTTSTIWLYYCNRGKLEDEHDEDLTVFSYLSSLNVSASTCLFIQFFTYFIYIKFFSKTPQNSHPPMKKLEKTNSKNNFKIITSQNNHISTLGFQFYVMHKINAIVHIGTLVPCLFKGRD